MSHPIDRRPFTAACLFVALLMVAVSPVGGAETLTDPWNGVATAAASASRTKELPAHRPDSEGESESEAAVDRSVAATKPVARFENVALENESVTNLGDDNEQAAGETERPEAGRPPAISTCFYVLSETSLSTTALGGVTHYVTVTTSSSCAWTVFSGQLWTTVSPSSGTGTGTVGVYFAPNTGVERTGSVSIAGKTVTVSQGGSVSCMYSLDRTDMSVPADAYNGLPRYVGVTATAGCGWTAASNDSWITVGGTATSPFPLTFAENKGAARTGTALIAGHTLTVNQEGAACSFTVSPTSASVGSAAGAALVTVTTTSSCRWDVVSNASWLSFDTGGSEGSGIRNVNFTANTGAARTGTVTIGGQTVTVTQSGAATCAYAILPTAASIAAASSVATQAVTVTASTGCEWTAVSNASWLVVDPSADGDTGSGTAGWIASANTGAARTGTIMIAGSTFTVNQAGATGCSYSIAPTTASVGTSATTGSVAMSTTAGCAWTAASNTASMLTVTGGASGTGSGTATYSVAANSGATRSGTLTIAGQTFTVAQSGASGCSFTVSPATATLGSGASSSSTTVTTTAGCTWTAMSNNSWLTITSGGSVSAADLVLPDANATGTGTVAFSAAANTGASRTGTITIAGQTFIVTQSAPANCTYAINPASRGVPPAAIKGGFLVTATAGCAWTATSDGSWLSVVTGSGTGNGPVEYAVSFNSGVERTGKLTVEGKTYTVTQGAKVDCTFTLGSTSKSVAATSTTGTVAVTATPSCSWIAKSNADWLSVTTTSGKGNGSVGYTVTANTASGRTGTLTVAGKTYTVTQLGASLPAASPFGSVDTPPANAAGVTGAIPVTGWALDNGPGMGVKVYRDPVSGETATAKVTGKIFLGDAVFVSGARPDIAATYATYPTKDTAGWGYMLLTNMLPKGGNGAYTLHAYAVDADGNEVQLGSRTITCTNATATKPFGAIDTPTQGGMASGAAFINFGWALTPLPKSIPADGSTITVVIDGAPVGSVTYNNFRNDIAVLFPGLANTAGAIGFRSIDTTKLTNGTHTIVWNVSDTANASDGLGSRYFTVENIGSSVAPSSLRLGDSALRVADETPRAAVTSFRRGYAFDAPLVALQADEAGVMSIEADPMERLEVHLGPGAWREGTHQLGDETHALPIGSHFDAERGIFYWQPGVGFQGRFDLAFDGTTGDGVPTRLGVRIVLEQRRIDSTGR